MSTPSSLGRIGTTIRKRKRRTQGWYGSDENNILIYNTSRSSPSWDRIYNVVVLTITALLLVLYCVNELPVLVNALVQHHISNNTGRPILEARKMPAITTTRPIPISLAAKRGENKESSNGYNFKEGEGDKQKSKGIIGRLFGSEKETDKKEKKKKDNSIIEDDRDKSYIVNKIGGYLRERQIRKDCEGLRREVNRREEERQQQLQRDAEELRLEVQRNEEERKRKLVEYQMNLVAKKQQRLLETNIATGKIDRTKIELQRQTTMNQSKVDAQKAMDKKDKDDEKSSSRRISNFVGSAQKLVSGVLGLKSEEGWIIVAPKTQISPGEIVAVSSAGIDLLLVASKDGSLHCLANSCPHLGTPLEVGSLKRFPIESSLDDGEADVGTNNNNNNDVKITKDTSFFKESDISRMLSQDGCEDCIVCPLHKTAFALESGEVRGEWCPYPPVIGKITGALKQQSNLPIFDVRTRGKNIEVRLNTPVQISD